MYMFLKYYDFKDFDFLSEIKLSIPILVNPMLSIVVQAIYDNAFVLIRK